MFKIYLGGLLIVFALPLQIVSYRGLVTAYPWVGEGGYDLLLLFSLTISFFATALLGAGLAIIGIKDKFL